MSLAALTVKIGADLTDLNKGLADAGREVGDLGKQLTGTGAGISGNLTAPLRTATEAAGKHHFALGRVSNALEGIASEALGLHGKLGSLSAKFLEFGVGGEVTLGVLGGLAILALAWEKLSESTRKASEETEKAVKLLEDVRRKNLLGPGGETGAAVEEVRMHAIPNAILKLDELKAHRADFKGNDKFLPQALRLDKEIEEQEQKLRDLRAILSDGQKKVTADTKTFFDNQAAERRAKFDKELADWRQHVHNILDRTKLLTDPLDTLLGSIDASKGRSADLNKLGLGVSSVASTGLASGAASGRIAGMQIPTSVFDSLGRLGTRSAVAVENAAHQLMVAAKLQQDTALRSFAFSQGIALLQSRGGTLGGILAGGIQGAIATGGNPFGAAIGAGTAFIDSLFNHRKSVDRNTDALHHLAEVMNAPSGFKVDAYRYRATQAFESDFQQRGGVAFANG